MKSTRAEDAPAAPSTECVPAASPGIRLLGSIGPGGEVELYREPAQVEVEILGRSIVARRIQGDCLGPQYNGWMLIYDDVREPPREELMGYICAMELMDGSILVKRLERGRTPGRFDLHSSTEPPIRNVPLRWASQILAFFPHGYVPASATDGTRF